MNQKLIELLKHSRLGIKVYNFLDYLMQFWWGGQVFIRDLWRFTFWSSTFRKNYSQRSLEARLIIAAHKIEKGFSLPIVKPAFGTGAVHETVDLLFLYQKRGYTKNTVGYRMAVRALSHYKKEFENSAEKYLVTRISIVLQEQRFGKPIKKIIKFDDNNRAMNFSELAKTRVSVRNFAREPIDIDLIREAINIARSTPSVCNRQGWKVYAYNSPETKEKILKIQGGNRGFGNSASWVLIITADLASFVNVKERNEAYIDGGLFSMSLIYALHSLGLGTCALNWCVKSSKDISIRKIVDLSSSDEIIMLLVVGKVPDNIAVALSEKREIDDILIH